MYVIKRENKGENTMDYTLELINFIESRLLHAERMKNKVIAEAMMEEAFDAVTFYAEILLEKGNAEEELHYIENLWDNEYNQRFYDAIAQGE